jgi:hypothetical protein
LQNTSNSVNQANALNWEEILDLKVIVLSDIVFNNEISVFGWCPRRDSFGNANGYMLMNDNTETKQDYIDQLSERWECETSVELFGECKCHQMLYKERQEAYTEVLDHNQTIISFFNQFFYDITDFITLCKKSDDLFFIVGCQQCFSDVSDSYKLLSHFFFIMYYDIEKVDGCG